MAVRPQAKSASPSLGAQSPKAPLPRIYHLGLKAVGGPRAAGPHFDRAKDLGFDTVLLAPLFRAGPAGDAAAPAHHGELSDDFENAPAASALSALVAEAGERGLALFIDVALELFDGAHPAVVATPDAFRLTRLWRDAGPIDPREPPADVGLAAARLDDAAALDAVAPVIAGQLALLRDAGIKGVRILHPGAASAAVWRRLLKQDAGSPLFVLAEMEGVPRPVADALRGAPFDAVTCSLPYWDGRASWFVEEYRALGAIAPVLSVVEPTFGRPRRYEGSQTAQAAFHRTLAVAGALGGGLLLPLGAEYGVEAPRGYDEDNTVKASPWRTGAAPALADAVRHANAAAAEGPQGGMLAQVTGPGRSATLLVRSTPRAPSAGRLILVNPTLEASALPGADILEGAELVPLDAGEGLERLLAPGEVRTFAARPRPLAPPPPAGAAQDAAAAPRIVIEGVTPTVSGAFPIKRVVGETLVISADVFSDGHDILGVELQWRPAGEDGWRAQRMAALGNDRWSASIRLDQLGRVEFQIEAWLDRFATFRSDLTKKIGAKVATALDVEEGVRLVEAAANAAQSSPDAGARVTPPSDGVGEGLHALAAALRASSPATIRRLLLAPETADLMTRADPRRFKVRSTPPALIDVERLRARYASWYELFPRSQGHEPNRHGDFDDVIARLPAIRDMGFDVVYFPPIHPIGRTHRKGRNNTLTATPTDPGSPYAIGAAEGGHDAVHPELGGLEAFRRLIAAATDQGLEIALDFAIQCSPDHPWLEDHKGWFDWRPDGSLKYAENPPKRYEDIVNVDFFGPDAVPGLWVALRDVVLFWVNEGVKIFRVDNPHTKPLTFWRWMIADVRSRHPDTMFLAEAFTRPKMMYRLAKVGFSQSYTYFTWRHGKAELQDYLTELADGPARDFFRPHFFVNTPDINPVFLQTSGRPGFLIRAALAATLSGLFGLYSGFELLEATPVPGKEEYLDSEKFELRPRNWTGEPNIIGEITLLNRLRRTHPALQTHLGVVFHPASNDNILFFSKGAPGKDLIVAAISLNPTAAEAADIEIPLWRLGLGDGDGVETEDLVSNETFTWRGARQWVRLEPDRPFALWRLSGEISR